MIFTHYWPIMLSEVLKKELMTIYKYHNKQID